jgi:YesN/AraC family two-component response regulator
MPTILIVEDEAQTRNIFLKCLEFEGFQAWGASHGNEGIQLAQRHQPDLIVCDIMMPDMDGYAVLESLRRDPNTALIPLIFLTAKVSMCDLRQGMNLGADDYLTKPCTVEQFLAAITTRLQRHRELAQLYRNAIAPCRLHPLTSQQQSEVKKSIFPDFPSLAPVFEFMEAHYSEALTLKIIADAIGYSPAYLTNLMQKKTGRSLKQWLTERRMSAARELLSNTTLTVREIAERSGYPDPSYFTRQFRQFHGVTPLTWRQNSSHL